MKKAVYFKNFFFAISKKIDIFAPDYQNKRRSKLL